MSFCLHLPEQGDLTALDSVVTHAAYVQFNSPGFMTSDYLTSD